MRKFIAPVMFGALAFAAPVLISSTAHAGLDACGNIDVSAQGKCEADVSGGCTAKCTPISFTAQCAAKGYVSCNGGECTASASGECTGKCDLSACEAKCNANPGSFDCEANCTAGCDSDCSANCQGKCAASTGEGGGDCQGKCEASCKATCSGECKGSCTGTPPSADCKAKCEGSCEGQCSGKANFSCQVDCQSKLEAQCSSELKGGCEAQCSKPEGALYCDGQYVDKGGNFQECMDALAAWTAKINASASGSATANFKCENGVCKAEAKAEGEASASCATQPGPKAGSAAFAMGALGLLAAWAIGRRRRED